MKKQFFRLSCLVLACVLLVSCGCADDSGQKDKTVLEIDLSKKIELSEEGMTSFIALVEDTLLCLAFSPDGTAKYTLLNLSTGQKTACGAIRDHLYSTANFAVQDGFVYFFVTTSANGGAAQENCLCRVDLTSGKLEILSRERAHLTFRYLAVCGNTLIAVNGREADGAAMTYLEAIDPQNNTRRPFAEHQLVNARKEGTAVTHAAASGEKIFAVVSGYQDAESVHSLYVYNLAGELMQTISMQQYAEDLMNTMISELTVFGDYVYIKNFSNTAVLGKIANGQFVEINAPGNELVLAKNDTLSPDDGVFFLLHSNTILLLDKESDTLIPKALPFGNADKTISYILKSGNRLLIYSYDEENPQQTSLRCIEMDDLASP